jgi:hypothetical protein
VELVQTYTRRWPAQENVIRDWLIPLGINVNHGYAKTVVANSEVAKKREALQKRLEHVQRWTVGPASACTMPACSTANAVNRRKNTLMRSIGFSMRINGSWSSKASSPGSCGRQSKRNRLWQMPTLRPIGNGSRTLMTPATESLPNARSTAGSSVNCSEPWRTWPTKNGRCMPWITARIR